MAEDNERGATGDPAETLRALVADLKGTADQGARVETLLEDNFKLRQKLRESRGRAAAPDQVLLSADEAKDWELYKALGKPSELRKALKDGESAQADLGRLRTADVDREAATLLGYKPTLFGRFARADGLTLDIADEQKDGKPARVPYVVTGDGDKDRTPLADYAAKQWADDLDALKAEPDTSASRPRQPPPGTPPRLGRTAPPPVEPGGRDPATEQQRRLVNYGRM